MAFLSPIRPVCSYRRVNVCCAQGAVPGSGIDITTRGGEPPDDDHARHTSVARSIESRRTGDVAMTDDNEILRSRYNCRNQLTFTITDRADGVTPSRMACRSL
jgi:hypothetical protein